MYFYYFAKYLSIIFKIDSSICTILTIKNIMIHYFLRNILFLVRVQSTK